MTNPREFKKQKLDAEADATVKVVFNRESSPKVEKSQENPSNTAISNKDIYHDGFIDLQGEDKESLEIKINRPLYICDKVVLLTNFPDQFLFKGYFCEIAEVLHHSTNPSECQYQIVFESEFDNNDKSRESGRNYPNFEFPSTGISHVVSGDDIARLHDQDLRYKTYFL